MMKRYAELKEIVHSLGRARSLAEQNNLIHLANTLTHSIGVLNAEIRILEQQSTPQAPVPAKSRRKTTPLEDHNVVEGEEK